MNVRDIFGLPGAGLSMVTEWGEAEKFARVEFLGCHNNDFILPE